MTQLILLRHGQSIWNRDRRFTGWTDVELSPQGIQEARAAGNLLKKAGYIFDSCFTSELKRSTETLQIVLSVLDQKYISIQKNWRLNERHYGELEGIKRWSAVKKFGFWPVLGCQLKFNIPPPLLDFTDERYPGNQLRYSEIDKNEIPRGESLQQTYMRMQPYWEHIIAPELQNGKKVLIVSHKNVLRTLIMRLEGISNVQHTRIIRIQIATARPLVYSLNNNLHIIKKQYISNV
ncbi:MAG: phosphoglyceromutase [Nitrosomonadaceae bacterium]|nr:phosphoglyceromutase [Nitrosomonadaceae bacterium]|tara:strand:- start:249 stop:953 length:705 start_codon:yes stop_codon:yes gene_type:complete